MCKGVKNMSRKDFTIPSRDGVHRLHVILWEPEDKGSIKGVVQISHGMLDMMERYEEFARYLNKNGYAVIGNDHLGHGLSAGNSCDFGYFCQDDISATLTADLHRVTRLAKKRYRRKPVFLLGHSMGSFLARRYMMRYPDELSGVILSGTGSKSPVTVNVGKALAALLRAVFGDRYHSRIIRYFIFKGYLSRVENARTQNDWLTRDEAVVDKYNHNKYCNFTFTINGYRGIFEVVGVIQKRSNLKLMSKDLPILLIAGKSDPVGGYGKNIRSIFRQYKKAGIKDVSFKLYKGDRHEILNELDRINVYEDILRWIDARAGKVGR
jgi:alpha-beta hydrolase superfamily lysophospholipase